MTRLIRKWAGIPVLMRARRLAGDFLRQAQRADEAQRRVLRSLLERHAESAFGRDHGFSAISSPEDYRRRVPVRDYEALEPYIARVRDGEIGALFGPGVDVLMFAKTSGTTARPKTIPVTRESLVSYRDGWRIWGIRAFDDHPGIIVHGMLPIVQFAGDWRESFTSSGIPCGAITGLTAHMQNPLVRVNYCVPRAASRITDVRSKYYVALRFSLHREVGAVIAANPSTTVGMARLGDEERQTLIRDLYDGAIDPKWEIPSDVLEELRRGIRRRRKGTARRLERIVEQTGRLLPKDYWPSLEFIANWTGGSMGAGLRHSPEYFGDLPVRDPGLIASEGRMTIPFEDGTSAGLLDYAHHYFEFIPEAEEDDERPNAVEAHELIEGRRYFLVMTTAGGLYRYNIRDQVECVGFEGRAPVLRFLNKGSHISSLTGEKLAEFQVVSAMKRVQRDLGLPLSSFLLLPSIDDPPYYNLLVEEEDLKALGQTADLVCRLDEELKRLNVEYANKRETLRLGPIRLRTLPAGSWDAYRQRRLAATGGTFEQYKQPCLLPDPDAIRSFAFREQADPLEARSFGSGSGPE